MIQEVEQQSSQFTGPLHSNSTLILHPDSVNSLKVTHPKYSDQKKLLSPLESPFMNTFVLICGQSLSYIYGRKTNILIDNTQIIVLV